MSPSYIPPFECMFPRVYTPPSIYFSVCISLPCVCPGVPRVCPFASMSQPILQHPDALYSIYRCSACGLPVSQRYSRQAAKGPAQRHPSAANGAGASSPRRQEARPIYATGEMERVGGKTGKTATAKKSAAPNPNRMRKKEKKRSNRAPHPRSAGNVFDHVMHTPT